MTFTKLILTGGFYLAIMVVLAIQFDKWLEPETWPLKPTESLSKCEPIVSEELDSQYKWEQCTTIRMVK